MIKIDFQVRLCAGFRERIDIRHKRHGLFVHGTVDAHVVVFQPLHMRSLDYIPVSQHQLGHNVLCPGKRENPLCLGSRDRPEAEGFLFPGIVQAGAAAEDCIPYFRQQGNLFSQFRHSAPGIKNHCLSGSTDFPDSPDSVLRKFLPAVEQCSVQIQGDQLVLHARPLFLS